MKEVDSVMKYLETASPEDQEEMFSSGNNKLASMETPRSLSISSNNLINSLMIFSLF